MVNCTLHSRIGVHVQIYIDGSRVRYSLYIPFLSLYSITSAPGEAKQRLGELREEAEKKSEENMSLQSKLHEISMLYEEHLGKNQQVC